jgi:hypothetical protein
VAAAAFVGLVAACGGNREDEETRWTVFDIPAPRGLGITRVVQYRGHEHCDTTSVTFLEVSVEGTTHQYLRDPEGRIRTEPLPEPLEELGGLPELSVWSGWRRAEVELWLAPDMSAAFVGVGEAWERWPAPPYEVWCD